MIFRELQPSVGGVDVGMGDPVGNGFQAALVIGTPQTDWDLLPVGKYVTITFQFPDSAEQFTLTVATPVENGSSVTIQPLQQPSDSQLWTAHETNGQWTFVPKLAPQYVLQMTNGAIGFGGLLSVGPPSDAPEQQATQLWIFADENSDP